MHKNNCFEGLFPLGLGTGRFPINSPSDTNGFEASIQLALQAIAQGVNYIDVGYTYASGMALSVLKEVCLQTRQRLFITAKTMTGEDSGADDVRRRFEAYQKELGLNKISHLICWAIPSYAAFERMMQRGGAYEGARRLLEEGLTEHICCSMHAPVADMIRIIESGAFEGVTVSYSLLNAVEMQPVLDAAYRCGVGVAVMNPLAGGIISQNRDHFSFACSDIDEGDIVHAALRFVQAHPAVDIVLGGVSSKLELEGYLAAITSPDPEQAAVCLNRVLSHAHRIENYCTGCNYCEGCPQGIPTSKILQARNALLFEPVYAYNRTGPKELLQDIRIFRNLYMNGGWVPETMENPCIQCGRCELRCTQKLNIIDAVADTYHRAEKRNHSIEAHKKRLYELLYGKGYQRVGLYPSSRFAAMLMEQYQEFFGVPDFEWVLFNSDSRMWGHLLGERVIYAPSEIPSLQPDIILICSYRHMNEIAETLRCFESEKIQVKILYQETDLPWLF